MDAQKTVRLFSYGTLQQEAVQLSTFGRRLNGSANAVLGYETSMVEIHDADVIATSGARFHPIIRKSKDPDAEMAGMVFDLTEAELAAADSYEVSDYTRVAARLKSGGEAWVYVAVDD